MRHLFGRLRHEPPGGRLSVGSLTIWMTPVSMIKGLVGMDWNHATFTSADQRDFLRVTGIFLPFFLSRPNDQQIGPFCDAAVERLNLALKHVGLTTESVVKFVRHMQNTLSFQKNRDEALFYTIFYKDWLDAWRNSSYGRIAERALDILSQLGAHQLPDVLGVAACLGNDICGLYVPWLRAVCVQMDVVCANTHPEVKFLETLIHEELHAVTFAQLGDDPARVELEWLHELGAVLTSRHAILRAAREIADSDALQTIEDHFDLTQYELFYGKLAECVLRETGDMLVAWRAWQRIFQLPPAQRRAYATCAVVTPILRRAGWNVSFPYRREGVAVDCAL
ncbi:MAG: hypothetical protein M3R61_03360 [Chloroflexota bacterium]|nr:hypothetical protein [Chloroflexota bacterium]